MKKTSLFGSFIIGALCLFSCNTGTPQQNHVTVVAPQQQSYQQQNYQQQPQNVTVQPAANIPGGFSVPNFANLLSQTSNPDALTQAINAKNNSINHLDLDGDGTVDYLRVDQLNDNTLVVMDEISQTQRAAICTLSVNNTQNNYSYSVTGVPDYCGSSYSYNSPTGLTLTQYAFLSWWFAPTHYHHHYHPAHWGYHSYYYDGYHPCRPRTGLYTTKEVITYRTTKTISSNNGSGIRQGQTQQKPQQVQAQPRTIPTVSNATTSQKQFSAGEGNRFKANNAGASNVFNKPAATPSYKPAPAASHTSFGGNKSSFGGGGRRSGKR
jgi:PBP1b-binding outer membrane lipoprotein LpoB